MTKPGANHGDWHNKEKGSTKGPTESPGLKSRALQGLSYFASYLQGQKRKRLRENLGRYPKVAQDNQAHLVWICTVHPIQRC